MCDVSSQESLLVLVEQELDAIHRHQILKAKKVAHQINPHLTDEDLLNPDNFPEIVGDPRFTYEDGIAAGILSAKIALRAALQRDSEREFPSTISGSAP